MFWRRLAIAVSYILLLTMALSMTMPPQATSAATRAATATPTVTLVPSSGNPNSYFNANGYGWPTNEFVDVYWYNIAGPVAGGNPDNNGNFVFNIQVINYVQPGTYQLLFEAVDGLTGQKTDVYKSFTITSTTNPCPVIQGSSENSGHCEVMVSVTAPSGTIGASSYIEVYKPTVATGDLESVAQLTVFNAGITFDIEVGWIVAPNQQWVGKNGTYTDSNTHLFVFVRNKLRLIVADQACLVQPAFLGGWKCGFVPASGATDYPGEILSLPGGTVKTFYVVNISGNWWIQYDANWIGYIKGSWFGRQFKSVGYASWHGEIATISSNPTTQMGNGTCGTKTSPAHFYTMQIESATKPTDAGNPKLKPQFSVTDTGKNYYNGKFSPTTSGTGSTLAYGGPTGCP